LRGEDFESAITSLETATDNKTAATDSRDVDILTDRDSKRAHLLAETFKKKLSLDPRMPRYVTKMVKCGGSTNTEVDIDIVKCFLNHRRRFLRRYRNGAERRRVNLDVGGVKGDKN
jgi:hypothetical protein